MAEPDDKAEERLRESEELNRRIIEAIPGGIVHVEADGAIRLANEEACRILGLSFDELTNKYAADFEPETLWEDGSPCAVEDYPVTKALVEGKAQPPVTIGVRRPDGKTSWAIFTAIPVSDPGSGSTTGAVVTFLDITDRRALQSKLMISDRMASVGTLAAGVAHEINNPLTFLIASLDFVAAWLDKAKVLGADSMRARIDDAQEGASRIRQVVRDLGTFSRGAEKEISSADVRDVVDTAARMAHSELKYRARLVRAIGDLPRVHASPSRLGQVFLNLLVNAGQAIEEGKLDENEVRVTGRATDDGRVAISVADTGCGMPPGLVERVFDPFVTTKSERTGTGLGLHICQDIVSSFGGEIRVESEVGKGSTFTVVLARAEATEQVAKPLPTRRATAQTKRLRVLVVDDEALIRRMVAGALGQHEVTVAASGREAIALLSSDSFDLVLCDLIMPDLTGMDVYDHLKDRAPAQAKRVVFTTAGAFTPRAQEFLDVVDNPVIEKPFNAEDIARVVEDMQHETLLS